MNFRVNVAVACAAALSFACADKPAAIPELEEAMNAPPGTRVVGLYRMDVTPVAGSDGRQFIFLPIPVGRDGSPLTNPPNSIQVRGTFGNVISNPTASFLLACPVGTPILEANVTVTNFTVESLANVWVDVTTAMPTGFTACNAATSSLPVGTAPAADGIWLYGSLAASAAAPGTAPGGAFTRPWRFKYPGAGSAAFYFRVLADVPAPQPLFSTTAPNWVSSTTNLTNLEICTAAPADQFAPCTGTSTLVQNIAGVGQGVGGTAPFNFTHTPALPNGTYWYRAINVYPNGVSPFRGDWNSFTIAPPPPAPVNQTLSSFAANDGAALLEWTSDLTVLETYYYLCAGSCAAAVPVILAQGPVLSTDFAQPDPRFPGVNYYNAAPAFNLDPATTDGFAVGLYWLPTAPAAYELRVFTYDGLNVPAPTDLGGAIGTIGITPVGIVPTNLLPAAGTISVAATTFSWNTDPLIGSTTVDFFDVTDPLTPLTIGQDIVLGTAGAYTLAASTAAAPTTLAAWLAGQPTTPIEVQLFNTDLYGTVSVLVRTYNMNP
jgi:hypothetical protein